MAKRPSLSAANVRTDGASTLAALRDLEGGNDALTATQTVPNPAQSRYHAATREGLKKVTVGLRPEERVELKILAARRGVTSEELLREAVADLLSKYKV